MNILKYILLIYFIVTICQGINVNSLNLKQVLILSRHNVRSSVHDTDLLRYSSKKWPNIYYAPPGHLTPKGYLMEGYMGEYFSEWFKSEKFLMEECPFKNDVYVYANSINRTIATAEAFVESAFRGCNVSVHHKQTQTEGEMDPIFDPIIRNTSDAFKTSVHQEIYLKLNNSKLKKSFLLMNKILDIENADICITDNICDLSDISKNEIVFEIGRQLVLNGPLDIANLALDSFVMDYYNGLPLKDVAWGSLSTPELWEIITEVGRQVQIIRYTIVAKDIGALLMKYLSEKFLNYEDMPKLMLIVGHDFNQNPIFNLMKFKEINLPNHYELFPIGGKIVFQRWADDENDYLKVEYVYATWTQTRNGTLLSLKNPPQRVLLELTWCSTNEDGFCPWKEFIKNLELLDF